VDIEGITEEDTTITTETEMKESISRKVLMLTQMKKARRTSRLKVATQEETTEVEGEAAVATEVAIINKESTSPIKMMPAARIHSIETRAQLKRETKSDLRGSSKSFTVKVHQVESTRRDQIIEVVGEAIITSLTRILDTSSRIKPKSSLRA
jgi:preprotein translocase subunit Sec63